MPQSSPASLRRPSPPSTRSRPAPEPAAPLVLPASPLERSLLPLRAFLGITFCLAGLQKLANPAFFHSANPASIQAQMAAAAHRSPIHALLGPLQHLAVPLGLLIAFGELAVGLGTLLGLYTRAAAIGGLVISFSLFLTVSFHTSPYYTGSDIVFVFAWIPIAMTGPTLPSIDVALAAIQSRAHERARNHAARPAAVDRRSFVAKSALGGLVAGLGLLGGGLIAALGRLAGGSSSGRGSAPLSSGTTGSSVTSPPAPVGTARPGTGSTSTTAAAARPAGTRIGPASDVPVGGAASFTDPRSGDPALVVRPDHSTFLAFDAVCPHAGCTVEYSSRGQLFVCPCHGSQFNGRTGDVEVGPAQSGLSRITIAEGPDGQLYAR